MAWYDPIVNTINNAVDRFRGGQKPGPNETEMQDFANQGELPTSQAGQEVGPKEMGDLSPTPGQNQAERGGVIQNSSSEYTKIDLPDHLPESNTSHYENIHGVATNSEYAKDGFGFDDMDVEQPPQSQSGSEQNYIDDMDKLREKMAERADDLGVDNQTPPGSEYGSVGGLTSADEKYSSMPTAFSDGYEKTDLGVDGAQQSQSSPATGEYANMVTTAAEAAAHGVTAPGSEYGTLTVLDPDSIRNQTQDTSEYASISSTASEAGSQYGEGPPPADGQLPPQYGEGPPPADGQPPPQYIETPADLTAKAAAGQRAQTDHYTASLAAVTPGYEEVPNIPDTSARHGDPSSIYASPGVGNDDGGIKVDFQGNPIDAAQQAALNEALQTVQETHMDEQMQGGDSAKSGEVHADAGQAAGQAAGHGKGQDAGRG